MFFKGYVKYNIRTVLCEVDIPVERAIDFLKENTHNFITNEDGLKYNLEELKNVKSFGSKDRVKFDNTLDPIGAVHEDSYRKLFGTLGYNTEPGSERDN